MASNRIRTTSLAAGLAVVMLAGCTDMGGNADAERADTGPRPTAGPVSTTCNRYAAPNGSNRASGSRARPYRTVQHLANRLRAGQTGCLLRGNYRENVRVTRGGRSGRPLTIRASRQGGVRLQGTLWITRRAPYVTIAGLYLDGKNRTRRPSPIVNGVNARFVRNDVTNRHSGICFVLGDSSGRYGRANRVALVRNRIHACGRLPRTNFDHGVYVESTEDALIQDNWIYDNADYGIHLFPDAQRTRVRGNVIERNGMGVIFAGDGGQASNHNVVEGNVIAASLARGNIEAYWPDGNPIPRDNRVNRNCLQPGANDPDANGSVEMGAGGAFTLSGNRVVADAGFANTGRNDLRLLPRSACRALFAGDPDGRAGPRGPHPPALR